MKYSNLLNINVDGALLTAEQEGQRYTPLTTVEGGASIMSHAGSGGDVK
jgi:hypothetical protein